jgi:hypothetical protein
VFVAGVIVSVELEPAATDDGLKDAVTPAGSPVTLKLIFPLKLLNAEVETVNVVLLPAATVWVCGVADNPKDSRPKTFSRLENEAR